MILSINNNNNMIVVIWILKYKYFVTRVVQCGMGYCLTIYINNNKHNLKNLSYLFIMSSYNEMYTVTFILYYQYYNRYVW